MLIKPHRDKVGNDENPSRHQKSNPEISMNSALREKLIQTIDDEVSRMKCHDILYKLWQLKENHRAHHLRSEHKESHDQHE